MNNLREFNNYILDKYNGILNSDDLSSPLLISSDEVYNNSLKRRIMYVGQETNGWFNYGMLNKEVTAYNLEETYFNFLKNGASNSVFWRYIKQILEISDGQLINNVIWSNTFIAGKRNGIGTPDITRELFDISLEYLLYIREYFKPNHIILVNGPNNPYYELNKKFLKKIKSTLIDIYPTLSNPLVIDEENNILWTYHPGFQNRMRINKEIMVKIKNKII
ncbi:MAG: hypothetical protein E7165_01105 [Firmicutes bacterium]|nr:hypothetical protein [Bacillota bacterium]